MWPLEHNSEKMKGKAEKEEEKVQDRAKHFIFFMYYCLVSELLSFGCRLDKITSHGPNTGSIIGGPYVKPLRWVYMRICNWTGIGYILRSFDRPPCSILPGRSVQQLPPDLRL